MLVAVRKSYKNFKSLRMKGIWKDKKMALLTEVNGCYSVAFCVSTCQSIHLLKQRGTRISQEQGSYDILKRLQIFGVENAL